MQSASPMSRLAPSTQSMLFLQQLSKGSVRAGHDFQNLRKVQARSALPPDAKRPYGPPTSGIAGSRHIAQVPVEGLDADAQAQRLQTVAVNPPPAGDDIE